MRANAMFALMSLSRSLPLSVAEVGFIGLRLVFKDRTRVNPSSGGERGRTSCGGSRFLPLVLFLVELLAGDLLFGHLGELDQEVDHFLLEDRRPDARHRLR